MMIVTGQQKNSRMCMICGLDNPAGVKAHFYNMDDGSVMTRFCFRREHQSYPGRVHGGMIAAMLDELAGRALWVRDEMLLGVTVTLTVRYRKPVPYGVDLLGKGVITSENRRVFSGVSQIMDMDGNVLAEADVRYMKMGAEQIQQGMSYHEEMCYQLPCDLTGKDIRL